MDLFETSLRDLYLSAVKAFPLTTLRQHATHPVVIKELRWVPFVGLKTLFIKGQVQNENKEHNTVILFKKVNYDGKEVKITASDGLPYSFDKLSVESTDVLVRCNCKDFGFRFNFYNHLDHSLYGRKAPKYISKGIGPPANPLELEGMCKHLIKTVGVLEEAGIFKD